MGKRGPRPHPTALRVIAGKKINDDEPQPETGEPTCPASTNPELYEVWEYTLDQLRQMRVVTMADRDALYAYCQAVIAHRRASDDINLNGATILGAMGGLVRNPSTTIQKEQAALIRQYAQEFGLTPSARSGMKVSQTQVRRESNDPARLLSG